ncbi:hypothetical protein GCM10010449_70580 [Streptomyces rectiviolaceus]|uniref:Uncharacterized protein n=1 Tax=Streptomyces rectiviolaceus TaxID=332591 RepID=A0ABP6NDW8_9ACTN
MGEHNRENETQPDCDCCRGSAPCRRGTGLVRPGPDADAQCGHANAHRGHAYADLDSVGDCDPDPVEVALPGP